MSTLFNSHAEGGYRLRSLEIYNWGTFHGKVYKLQPNGRTSLLTGANGSGKTTLIDALLTLMVPSNKRFYNQSSGADSKKERDESSYFWGYYGKTYSDMDERSKMEQLRSKSDNPYSVLLACFQNSATLHTISLVQVRWFSNGMMKKVYVVSPYPLSITEHFGKGHFDTKGEWRRKLQKQFPKTDLFDSFKDYAARFSDLFGLKEKALPLFNQTVGIKVLGDLTVFIRQQMLEEPDAEEQFKNLHSHYIDLLISHKVIKKDERQLQLLFPIIEHKAELTALQQSFAKLQSIQEQLIPYLNKKEFELIDAHLLQVEGRINTLESENEQLAGQITQLEEEERQLITQKALLNIDSQIQLLNKDIATETEKRDGKRQSAEDYQKLAKSLDLPTPLDEDIFVENMQKASAMQAALQQQYDDLAEKKTRYKIDIAAATQKIEDLQEDITSLLSRNNRIPKDLVIVRERLLELLGTGEAELPFVGELIKVKESCRHWEDVIERVLHSFSMQLLVPEKYTKLVNQFVHSNNLQTKLVYQKIERKPTNTLYRWPTDDDSLLNKLELREAHGYTTWLERQLVERFGYHCTDDLDVFYGSSKAVTSNGLIRNVNRHEKDDRAQSWSKFKYRLGWDNKDTVRLLQEEKYRQEKEHRVLRSELEALGPQLQAVMQKQPLLTLLTGVKSFHEIHWQLHAEKIESFTRQIEELTGANDQYQTITKQLHRVQQALKGKRKTKEELVGDIKSLERDGIEKNKRKLAIQFDELTTEGQQAIDELVLTSNIQTANTATLEQLDAFKKELALLLRQRYAATSVAVHDKELQTLTDITAFVHPDAATLSEFPDWSGDVLNIEASLRSLEELEELYKTVRHQRLVEHKKRFQEYMDRSMLDALTNYRTWLYNEEEKINDIIDELNIPLKKITFNKNPDTYLQLECKTVRDQEIKVFKEQLSATIPNALEFATQKEETYRLAVFEKIKTLIGELQKEESWRRKVTDIRNWLTFSAREYSVAEDKPGQYHDNTASYSGGQKAQFTYAILGAAISHQFGIYQPGKQQKSLRFITVDEAFSKLDPEKSEFLMEFCAQLNLQILVVTPLDKINIAEPFIHAVHFVEIKNKMHSMVYNLTMEEYMERKEEFHQLAKITDDNA